MEKEAKLLIESTRKWNTVGEYSNLIQDIDWNYFWELCVFHKVVGIAFQNLYKNAIEIPEYIEERVSKWQEETIRVNSIQRDEYSKLSQKMGDRIIALKGIWLINFLYESDASRRSEDIDLMFLKRQKTQLDECLKKEGYVQGIYDYKDAKIIEASRNEILYHEIYTHETYPYIKLVDNIPIYFDCNFKFSWYGAKTYSPPQPEVEDLLEKAVFYEKNSLKVNSLNPEWFFVHLCVHCYNEYYFFLYQNAIDYRELRLYRLNDIRTLVQKMQLKWHDIEPIIRKIGAEKQVSFCLGLSHYIYSDFLFDGIKSEFEYLDLNKYISKEGKYIPWNISLYDRVFNMPLREQETDRIFLTQIKD